MTTTRSTPSTGTVDSMVRRKQILRLLLRYRHAGVLSVLPTDTATPADRLSTPTKHSHAQAEQFAADLEALGATFVKLGQVLSTRPDMVPPAYIHALARMQEQVTPIPVGRIKQLVENEFGQPIQQLFLIFDPDPLGSASIAQVHRAVLHDGREVAVKVQRPDIALQLDADLIALRNFANAADRLTRVGRRMRLGRWLDEFTRSLRMELDYSAEAANLERFGHHLAPYPELWLPQPVRYLCTQRVLTMELVRGIRIDEISAQRRHEHSMDALAAALVRGYLDQIFVHGEIHADPHPGNLRVTPDGRLAIFDLGMVAHVPPRLRERLLKVLFAALDGRGEEVADEIIAISTRLERYDEERYLRETGQMIARYAANAALSEGRVVLEIVRIATSCELRAPPELVILGKALLNLENVCHALAPTLDMRAVVENQLQSVIQTRIRKSFSQANIASEVMEMQHFLRHAPRRVNDILGLMAENRLQIKITGLKEARLMENIQKIANRVAAGLITSALLLSAAFLMRIESQWTLFGYPVFALLLFWLAISIAVGLIISSAFFDRSTRSEEREVRGHR